MSTPLDAEALRNYLWIERARCAAVGLALHWGVFLLCLLTVNPLLMEMENAFRGILILFMVCEVASLICFFCGIHKKNRWLLLPIIGTQGAAAGLRLMMFFGVMLHYLDNLAANYSRYNRSSTPIKDLDMAMKYICAYLAPVNMIAVLCFYKAFKAIPRSSASSVPSVPPRDHIVPSAPLEKGAYNC